MTHEGVAAPEMPSDVDGATSRFDTFADWATALVSRAPFFAACVLLVVVWLLEGLVRVAAEGSLDAFLDETYQLQINTTTTIVTFLLVALLQNSSTRADAAVQHKLNAIADGLADLMDKLADRLDEEGLAADVRELQLAVGLEEREGSDGNGRS